VIVHSPTSADHDGDSENDCGVAEAVNVWSYTVFMLRSTENGWAAATSLHGEHAWEEE